jgi:glycosyltransferase involved in cell wall biosynthesis
MHSGRVVMQPRVAIVLAYFNGARWIEDQLQSIEDQEYPNIDVFIFDDASQRAEKEFLASIVDRYKRVTSVVNRPSNLGFQMNFLEGLKEVKGEYDYYGFSDQDDMWYPNKISRAVEILSANNSDYKLYGSRTEIFCDEKKKSIGFSPLMKKPPSFGNSLVQNIMGGNTMVFCDGLKRLLIKINTKPVSHDWITYQLGTGVGGFVFYDSTPSLMYRQTGCNQVGENNSILAKVIRLRMLFGNRFLDWSNQEMDVLSPFSEIFIQESRETYLTFKQKRMGNIVDRIKLLMGLNCKLRRQTFWQNVMLFIGLLVKKI